ncbi:MAG: hypothetical protein C0475_06080 [Planctomyces sp.]|nr:hypothetical protein [Planctomyces sp.]
MTDSASLAGPGAAPGPGAGHAPAPPAAGAPDGGAHPGRDAEPAGTERALASAVRVVSGVTLLSRLGGLLRDVVVILLFGTSATGSAVVAAMAIPNIFRRLFGEGALSAAFLPVYSAAQRQGRDRADALLSLTVAALGALTAVIALAVCLGVVGLVLLLPGDADRGLSLGLIAVTIWFMPAICAAAILAAALQVHGRFGPASSGPLVLNGLVIVAGGSMLLAGVGAGPGSAYALAAVTVLSGVVQVWWFARALRGRAAWNSDYASAAALVRGMLRRFVPVALGLGAVQLSVVFDTFLAMYPIWVGPTLLGRPYPLDAGSNVIVTAAARMYQFPLGVFGIAVATAAFPMLAAAGARSDGPALVGTLRRSVRLSLLIGLPASVGLVLVRQDVMAVFSIGGMGLGERGAQRAAAALLGFAPAVWAYGLNHVLSRGFYAIGDTRTPMRVSVAMVGVNACVAAALIWPLQEAGIAWATSIGATAQCAALGVLLMRRVARTHAGVGSLLDAATALAAARLVVAAAVMGAAVWAVTEFYTVGPGTAPRLWRLGLCVAAGAAVYAAAGRALGAPEVGWVLRGLPGARRG